MHRPPPRADDLEYEALPNEFRNLPRMPARRAMAVTAARRAGAPLAGMNWFTEWLTPVKSPTNVAACPPPRTANR